MKKLLALSLALLMILMLGACGGSTSQTSSSDAEASGSEAVSEKTTLIIGLDDQFPPMGFRDENNNLVGFDIDLATEAAKRAGLEAVPTPIDWTTKELELNGDKVDVLWNGLTITPERQEAMLLSTAYIANAQGIVVKTDSGIATLAVLAGKGILV